MASQQERAERDATARRWERRRYLQPPGGTGGLTVDDQDQEHLAEGRSRGGQSREGQKGTEGHREMGRKGGLSSTAEQAGGERAGREGFDVDDSKLRASWDSSQL